MALQLEYTEVGKSTNGKTSIRHVSCNGTMLGVIKWYSNWRRYVFYPEINTLFDAKCLGNIQFYLERMTDAHRSNEE